MDTERRVRLGSIIVGLVATLGVTAVLVALGVAVLLATIGTEAPEARGAAIAWAAGAGAIGAFVGGRLAAVDARAVTRRDGAIHGFITWAAWSGLAALVAVGVGMWAWAMGGFDVASAARRPDTLDALWGALVAHAAMFVGAIWGGVRGARAEARAIGLLAIHPPDSWDDVDDAASMERRYLAES
ncbi:MAG TPA: hypothetical protein VKE22_13380 [Haliangiales bacterium]|nr:hypothetical protein [Haliangiales bacterium]